MSQSLTRDPEHPVVRLFYRRAAQSRSCVVTGKKVQHTQMRSKQIIRSLLLLACRCFIRGRKLFLDEKRIKMSRKRSATGCSQVQNILTEVVH